MRSWAGTGAAFRDLSAVGGSEDPRVTVFITGKHMGGSLGFREISRSLIFEAVSLRDPPYVWRQLGAVWDWQEV